MWERYISLEYTVAMIGKHRTYKYKVYMAESQTDILLWSITFVRESHECILGITIFKFPFGEV